MSKTSNLIQAIIVGICGGALANNVYDSVRPYSVDNPEERLRWILRGAGIALAMEHLMCYGKLYDDKLECHGLLGLAMVGNCLNFSYAV